MMNSVIFIWQSVERCKEMVKSWGTEHKAKCSLDVSYAIEAVDNVINLVSNAAEGCEHVLSRKEKCNSAVMSATSAMAAVAGASSGIAEDCPKHSVKPAPGLGEALSGTDGKFPQGLALCIVDAKELFWSVLHFGANANDAHQTCGGSGAGSPRCVDAVLHTLDSVAQVGEFIAGVVGHCTEPGDAKAKCASDVLALLRDLNSLGVSGNSMSKRCGLSRRERLYLQGKRDHLIDDEQSLPLPTIGLAALLPITAVLSFVVGRRMAKARQPSYDPESVEFECVIPNTE